MKRIFILTGLLFMLINLFGNEFPINMTLTSPYGLHPEFNSISYDDLNWKNPEDQIVLFNLIVNKQDNNFEQNGEIRFSMSWNDIESVEVFKGYQLPLSLTNKDIIRASYPGGLFTVEGNLDDVFNALKPLVLDTGKVPDGDYTFKFVTVEEGFGNQPNYEEHQLSNEVSITFSVKSPIEITLISPGTPITSTPVAIHTITPYFVWVSNFDEYTLKFWEELPNINSEDQYENITPYYTATINNSMNFEYPSNAPSLQVGKTYAWQVVAKLKNSLTADASENSEYQKSRIYHFRIDLEKGNHENISVLENYLNRYKPNGWKSFLELIHNGYNINQEDLDKIISKISSGKKIKNIEIQ